MKKIKQNRGITLMILIIYMILTTVIIGILATLTVNFRRNINNVNEKTSYETEFDKINLQMIQETKIEKNFIDKTTITNTNITFANGNTYSYSAEDKAIYLNNIKIAENITDIDFNIQQDNGRQKLVVTVKIGDNLRRTEYTIAGETSIIGKRVDENTEYEDNGKIAWIPKGFTVSGIQSEQKIDTGLVIYDIPQEEVENIDWTDLDGVRTTYNQFVWIPIEGENFIRTLWENNQRSTSLEDSTDYTEPFDNASTKGIDEIISLRTDIENIKNSVSNYGGFWFGRYEAGSETERTRSSGVTTLGIKQDMYPYQYVKWGESMNEIGTAGAVYLSSELYNSDNYGAKSMLCTGACWDAMIDFVKDDKRSVMDCLNWGNYYNASFTITRGEYALFSNTLGDFIPVDETHEKASLVRELLTTGATVRNSSNNIFDTSGNCAEWTTEAYSSEKRVYRGRYLWTKRG